MIYVKFSFWYEFKLLILILVDGHDVVNGSIRHGKSHEMCVSLKVTTIWQHVFHDVAMADEINPNFWA